MSEVEIQIREAGEWINDYINESKLKEDEKACIIDDNATNEEAEEEEEEEEIEPPILSRSDSEMRRENEEYAQALLDANASKAEIMSALEEDNKIYSILCPISYEEMEEPVLCDDGHTYEQRNICNWCSTLEENNFPIVSPVTRQRMNKSFSPNNYVMSTLIDIKSKYGSKLHLSGITGALNSEVFQSLDALMHKDIFVKLNLKEPLVVVLGSEDQGKSSVLERLISYPIFPRNQHLCTRCPTRVKLRRTTKENAKIPKVYVRHRATGVISNVNFVALEQIGVVIKELMDEMIDVKKRQKIVADREVVVELNFPNCPNIDIMDLPGMIAAPAEDKAAAELIAKSIINEEKNHSIFLMVVDCRAAATLSLASGVIEECGIQDRTIGILTRMDLFTPNYGLCKEESFSNHFDPDSSKYFQLKKWMGCANIPVGYEDKPMLRIIKMEQQEADTVKNEFPKLFKSKIIGMPAIRQAVQLEFERFICNDWLTLVFKHLTKEFEAQSVLNISLGVPMVFNEAYMPYIEHLRSIVPRVIPRYDVKSNLAVRGSAEFRNLVFDRIKDVCNKPDWIRFGTWLIWPIKEEFDSFVSSCRKTWEHMPFEKCYPLKSEVENNITQIMIRFINALSHQSQYELSGLLKGAITAEDSRPVVASKKNWWGKTKKVVKEDCVDPAINKFERFLDLLEQLNSYCREKIAVTTAEFTEMAMKMLRDKQHSLVEVVYRKQGNSVQALLRWTNFVEIFPHAIVTLWFQTIVNSIPSIIARWDFPERSTEETCFNERILCLRTMVHIATALLSFSKLQYRVENADIRDSLSKQDSLDPSFEA